MKQEQIDYLLTRDGWCSEEKMKRLFALVLQTAEEFKGQSILSVELGVFGGRSLLPMALAHQQLQSGYAVGIDAWDNVVPLEGTNTQINNDWWAKVPIKDVYNGFIESARVLGTGDYCRHLIGKTEDFINQFEENSITLLHQDSSHNIETITRELQLYSPKMRTGGYWVVDDTDWEEAKAGYASLPQFGFTLIEDYGNWQIWRKKI